MEYIPPITQEGQDCLSAISIDLNECNNQASLDQQQCQINAQVAAQDLYKQALIDHEQQVADMKKRMKSDIPKKYQTFANIGIGMMEATAPQLNQYVQDSHCYSNNGCLAQYDEHYRQCGGNVITTTRCFANCGEGQ